MSGGYPNRVITQVTAAYGRRWECNQPGCRGAQWMNEEAAFNHMCKDAVEQPEQDTLNSLAEQLEELVTQARREGAKAAYNEMHLYMKTAHDVLGAGRGRDDADSWRALYSGAVAHARDRS